MFTGQVDEAATVLQELQVETFGSMERREKVDFILEQMRLALRRRDFIRLQIISKKINPKVFATANWTALPIGIAGLPSRCVFFAADPARRVDGGREAPLPRAHDRASAERRAERALDAALAALPGRVPPLPGALRYARCAAGPGASLAGARARAAPARRALTFVVLIQY